MSQGIQVGMCLFGLGGARLEDACLAASMAGVRHVSLNLRMLSGYSGGMDRLLAEPDEVGRMVQEKLSGYGLLPVELFMCAVPLQDGVAPSEPDPALRSASLEVFRTIARFAAAARFRHVMGVPGTGDPASADWNRACALSQSMVDIARQEGIGFSVEPHLGSLIDQPSNALRMAEEVPGLRYTLDYSHFHTQGIPLEEIYPLHPLAIHIHAKQATVGARKTLWHRGTIPFDVILRQLRIDGWEGVVSPEYIGEMPLPGESKVPDAGASMSNPLLQNLAGVHQLSAWLSEMT